MMPWVESDHQWGPDQAFVTAFYLKHFALWNKTKPTKDGEEKKGGDL